VTLKNSWLFPALQSVHVAGLALLVGAIVLLDLRLLGWALRRQTVAEVTAQVRPWIHRGLATVLITGAILFSGDTIRYLQNPAFLIKMAILLLALVIQFTLRRARLTAVLSLVLWTCVVLAGRAIADFDIF
jgi:hypothetical protein